jgi:transcriptional regulator with XRE-family HTH domain
MMGRAPRSPQSAEHVALGVAIRVQRTRLGFTQEALGFAAEMHRNYVGAIERGEINPSFALLMRLSRGLELPVSELMLRYEAEAARREQPRRSA